MSGEKRTPIQILQDQMLDNRRQLYDIQQQRDRLQQSLNNMQTENAAKYAALRTELEKRDQKMAAVANSLKSELRNQAAEHQQQMAQQRQQVLQEMQDLEVRVDQKVENLRNWTKGKLDEQRREYQRISQLQQQQINNLKIDIEQINRREEHREKRATVYLSDLEQLIQAADQYLPHQRFAPGHLDKIKRQLEAARRQLREDVPAAAIATIQRAHFELMDLEEDIMNKEMEFEMTYRTVADAVGALFTAVRQNRQIKLENNATLQEADFWTNGRYQVLEDKIKAVREHIDQNQSTLTTVQLNNYLNDLEQFSREQETLVNEAVERIISSQLRAEIGDVVIEKLEAQGYRVQNGQRGYSTSDQREPYMIKLSNVLGTEIVTVISPNEKTYENTLSINTYNEEHMDDEGKRKRNTDLLVALREGGLHAGETICNDQGIHEFYDVENLIKQGSKKLPKQVVQQASDLSVPSSAKTTNK
ncbi:hypothetical protein [Chitinophaga sp. S165]|uniref:hypothetical protein n=1 Tax=Chitinophaga sp. S165 TaxID=2135462 RepID=UPI000D70BB9C|nr:hypothetical protein [Chitinophaga sp. S165]PWV45829.1 hypothetical protein C7475_11246 [Chitinophaga sp. S165]